METTELTGSDKQITWASDIRKTWIADIARLDGEGRRTMEKRGMLDDPRYVAFVAAWNAEFAAILAEHTDAAWWIDHRGTLRSLTDQIKRAAMTARDAA